MLIGHKLDVLLILKHLVLGPQEIAVAACNIDYVQILEIIGHFIV